MTLNDALMTLDFFERHRRWMTLMTLNSSYFFDRKKKEMGGDGQVGPLDGDVIFFVGL